jgi:hypothetical protein
MVNKSWCLWVPLILEHYAENIVPVTSMDVQALRTGYDGSAWACSIVYRPVVDDDGTRTGSGIRACHSKLVPVWIQRGLEQVEVAEAVLGVLNGYTAWSDLEIGHG